MRSTLIIASKVMITMLKQSYSISEYQKGKDKGKGKATNNHEQHHSSK